MVFLGLLLALFFSPVTEAKQCKNALKELLELYSDQNKKMMVTRVENASNKHKFIRSFIPYYYKTVFESRDALPVFAKLKAHRGKIVGDAHVENFGFMVNNKGKTKFTMNDFDDTADAPYFLDIMKLSQSAAYTTDINQAKLIEAYRKGLAGKSKEFSSYTKALEQKSIKGGATSKAEFETTKKGKRFAEKNEPYFSMTKTEEEALLKTLKSKFKDVKLHDSYRTTKEGGGSAFGTRYHALVDVDGKTHFIELKEINEGGVISNWVTKKVSDETRIKQSMAAIHGDDFNQYLDVVSFDGKPYQVRFKLEGNKAITMSKVDEAEIHSVIEDEFYLLGQIHRTSLGGTDRAVSAYSKDLDTVTIADWEESLKVMKKEIKKKFNALND